MIIGNQPIVNRNIAYGNQLFTVGNDSTSYTIDIPAYGVDEQTRLEIDDASGIVLSNLQVLPLGLRVDIDVSSAVVGQHEVKIISGATRNDAIGASDITIDYTGVAGGVSCSNINDVNIDLSIRRKSRSYKSILHSDFVFFGGEYQLSWDSLSYRDYDLSANISGGDPSGTYVIILPDTDTLEVEDILRMRLICSNKLDGQQLYVRPINAQDEGRTVGRVSSSTPVGHILQESDVVQVAMTRISPSDAKIAFENKGKHTYIIQRVNPISTGPFGNPSGNNMVGFSYTEDGDFSFQNASGQAWNVAGLEKNLRVSFVVEMTALGNSLWTTEAWLSHASTGEIFGSRRVTTASNTNGAPAQMTSEGSVTKWNNNDGNMVFKIYHQGQSGLFTKIQIVLQEL